MANDYDPLKITLDDRPAAILRVMDDLTRRTADYDELSERRRYIPAIVLGGAVVLVILDLVLGFGDHFFCLPAVPLAAAAVVMWIAQRRGRPQTSYHPNFGVAREVIYTLRDDLHPSRGFFGHIDLTGWRQSDKLAQEEKNALGLLVGSYRDEWLSLRAKLYDGCMLRVSAIERAKERLGYSKRSAISGKTKWKPPKFKGSAQQLRVRISVNPEVYEIGAPPAQRTVGHYTIEQLDTTGGIVSLAASASVPNVTSGDILDALRLAYSVLRRKG